jgi:hypothetical protein
MTSFEIKSEEIQEVIQYSKLQGGSKHRQKDIYALLDRVVARGELQMPEKKSAKHEPEWLSQALNEGDGVYRP